MVWDGVERRQSPLRCETEILQGLAELRQQIKTNSSLLAEIHTALHGNGKEGLLIEHDRLKQIMRMGCWVIGTVWVAILGIVIKLLGS